MKRLLSAIVTGITLFTLTGFRSADTEKMDAVSAATEKTTYTAEDLRNLQDFILAKSTGSELEEKSYDLNNDGIWDTFDPCLMRREVISNDNDVKEWYDTLPLTKEDK